MAVGITAENEPAKPVPANRELTSGRGKQREGSVEASGGNGGGGIVGVGNFAERATWAEKRDGGASSKNGGKGLEIHNPNPNKFYTSEIIPPIYAYLH